MVYVILVILLLIGMYFTIRYFLLVYALKRTTEDLNVLADHLNQNQSLKLIVPNSHLGQLVKACNHFIERMRQNRHRDMLREKAFKKQIENISHDLRTPLTVILGYVKMMKAEATDVNIVNQRLAIIERKAEGMQQLVDQFYDYSRFSIGDDVIQYRRVDLRTVIQNTLLDSHELLTTANIEVKLDIPEQPSVIMGDRVLLDRIYLNLLQNVSRYAKSYFHLSVYEEAGQVICLFENDTKVPMERDIEYLFDRFYMQNEARNQAHTGLGLTIAKSLTEMMNGSLRAMAIDREHRIQFELTFPLQPNPTLKTVNQ